ncbi:hypothetical protein DFH28DRAFT_12774 [Melampsora americana]|nr:hypothetical protein DFH28DRAFT_12774 [Melampsora americana]
MNTSIPSKSKSKSKSTSTSTSKSEFQSEFEFQTNGSILKLKEKQRELRWILELNEMSEGMSNQVKELSEQILLGSNGLKVVQKFQNVFVYAQKAIATRTESNINSDDPRMMNPSRSQRKNPRGLMEEDLPIDGLVRIPLSDQSDSIEGL